MHINAFLWEIIRMRLLITGGFYGQSIQRRHFCLHRSKGRCHGKQILAIIGKHILKMAITSVVCTISMQRLVWDRVCAIGEFICDTLVHKGQREVTMAASFGTKIAVNTFLPETTRMWLLITGSFCGPPIWRRHLWLHCKVLRHIAAATKFWPI